MLMDEIRNPIDHEILKKLKVTEGYKEFLSDPILFCRGALNLELFPYQQEIIKACIKKPRVVVRMARQAGKSTVIAAFCVYWAFMVPHQKILIVSATYRQADNLFRIIKGLIHNATFIHDKIVRDYVTEIKFDNQSEIKAVPTGTDGHAIRGLTAHVLILEESAFIDEKIVTEVALPMASDSGAKILQISTPIGHNHFYKAFQEGSGYAPFHFDYKDAINAGRFTKAVIEEKRRGMTAEQFVREYKAQFTEDSNFALPWEVIAPCVDSHYRIPDTPDVISPSIGEYYLGLDIGRFGSSTVFSLIVKTDTDVRFLYYKELIKTPFAQIFGWIVRLSSRFNITKIMIDSTGMGLPIVESLKTDKRTKNFRIVPIIFSTKSKHEMFSHFRKLLEDKRLRLPDDKRMIDQFLEQKKDRVDAGGRDVFSCPKDGKDDILWSLCLACWAFKRGELVTYVKVH